MNIWGKGWDVDDGAVVAVVVTVDDPVLVIVDAISVVAEPVLVVVDSVAAVDDPVLVVVDAVCVAAVAEPIHVDVDDDADVVAVDVDGIIGWCYL